ncbi:hypothetical protein ACFE04_028079 [Oxalis oulophora]
MTSSMLSGDRRWTSGRKSGMTVLGKVAVPKPINLPSQRLENHGLDPSVEIVPKGTLGWGSKSSSSSTNAWGSSTLSPNTDGGGGSPSHLSGRPSSGGGTRPSTAGSDRSHEPNAWGSNSRPSSASGALAINQTSATTLRPRSAETRPGSAQLSRFAEASSESSSVRSTSGINEKSAALNPQFRVDVIVGDIVAYHFSGDVSFKNDGFSLTSGDFPTLGLEKEISGKNTESQDHGADGRPGSSSGVAPPKEGFGTSMPGDVSVNDNMKVETSNSYRRDFPPNVDKWQPDFQSYPNPNMPPQHYDAWRGPPMNNHPAGVWYRGPPGGPPYNSPVPPGGFPMEPFPYYRPQIPAGVLANPHLVPPPGAGPGPRGPHPKNGDMYRPHMPDAYMRPGMPVRPGFYHGPPMPPCEGYYGPPVGYCNSNERDIIFMGMPAGPPPYNRYGGPNAPDSSNSHARPSGHGPSNKPLLPEQPESGNNPHEPRGPYKVLLKHSHDGWDGKDEGKNWEDSVNSNAHVDRSNQPPTASRDNDWRTNRRTDDEMDLRRRPHGEEASQKAFDRRGAGSSAPHQSVQNSLNMKPFDEVSVKKHEHPSSEFHGVPAAAQDSSLIQKIESLNAKARAAEGRPDVLFISEREEQKNKSHVVDGKGNHSANVYHERAHTREITDSTSSFTGGPVISRTPTHGKVDHRSRARSNNAQEVDGHRKKFPAADSSGAVSTLRSEVHVQEQKVGEVIEMSAQDLRGKNERGNGPPLYDPSDTPAQRTKMAELAKQRALQRQKEEEERTREQKAKALAKLEELNKRTQAVDVVNQKSETVPISDNKQLESRTAIEPRPTSSKLGASSSVSALYSSTIVIGKATVPLYENLMSKDKKPETAQTLSIPLQQEVDFAESALLDNAPQAHDHKQKRAIFIQKQNIMDKPTSVTMAEEVKDHTDLVDSQADGEVGGGSESNLSGNTGVVHESSLQQRKKYNKSSKYKHKVDDSSTTPISPSVASHDTNCVNASGEIRTRVPDPTSVKPMMGPHDANQSSSANEGIDRVNNHLKPLHPRRTSRNPQANRATEKFHGGGIWAPVRANNKSEVPEEAGPTNMVESSTDQVPLRNKRAEMERYVPKPVAKEIAQQVGSPHSVAPTLPKSTSDETGGRAGQELKGTDSSAQGGLSVGKVGGAVMNSGGDKQNNKQGKGSWRQRGSESINMPPSQTSRNVEHSHPQKPEASTVKVQPASDEWNAPDKWNVQGGTGKGKRHASKGHKGTGGNQDFDLKKTSSEDSDKVSAQDSVPISRSTAHWQPKSQASSGTNQKGSSQLGSSRENVSASVSEKNFADATSSNLSVQEAKREHKITSTNKRLSHPTSQGPRGLVEQPQLDFDAQQEHRPPSGHRRNGNQNNRFGRGHDNHGDWTSSGQDNNKQLNNAHRDNRQRPNSHFEYQPVISQNNSRGSNFEGSKDGSSRFRDRNQSHSKRGGARQSGTVQADEYWNGEREAQQNDGLEANFCARRGKIISIGGRITWEGVKWRGRFLVVLALINNGLMQMVSTGAIPDEDSVCTLQILVLAYCRFVNLYIDLFPLWV